jgi:YD repeat-containing protein
VTQEYNLGYDAENSIVSVTGVKGTTYSARFYYDGDGRRVRAASRREKSVINGETTFFAGGHFELKGNEVSKYYFAGASRIAVRKYIVPQTTTLNYLAGDQLGSTSHVTDATRVKTAPALGNYGPGIWSAVWTIITP